MKKFTLIAAMLFTFATAQAQITKDTVRIHTDRLELTKDKQGKPKFILYSDDNLKTRKVNTNNGSAQAFQKGGTPYLIYRYNEFGEKVISKVYVTSK